LERSVDGNTDHSVDLHRLQLLFFALGWLDLGINGAASDTTRAVVSGVFSA
jgi:hypothetical protein